MIIFAPIGDLVLLPLRALLWEERQLVSVANLTRQDGIDFLRLASKIGIVTTTARYPPAEADRTLDDLRHGRFEGVAAIPP